MLSSGQTGAAAATDGDALADASYDDDDEDDDDEENTYIWYVKC